MRVCILALVIQHADHIRSITMLSVACLVLPYFSIHKRHHFLKTVIEYKICVLIYSTNLSEIFPILRRIQRDIIIHVQTSSCKVPVLLVRF
jgi:hypothetical protein